MNCHDSSIVKFIYAILFQVVLIFMFLTLFFFFYVVKIEREDYSRQIKLIVDDIFDKEGIGETLNTEINELTQNNTINKSMIRAAIDTSLTNSKTESTDEMKDQIQKTTERNKQVRNTGIIGVTIGVAGLLLITVLGILSNFCIPLAKQFKETLIIVLFVGITEFTFLTFVASRYISADSYKVQREFGDAIVAYATSKQTPST